MVNRAPHFLVFGISSGSSQLACSSLSKFVSPGQMIFPEPSLHQTLNPPRLAVLSLSLCPPDLPKGHLHQVSHHRGRSQQQHRSHTALRLTGQEAHLLLAQLPRRRGGRLLRRAPETVPPAQKPINGHSICLFTVLDTLPPPGHVYRVSDMLG